MHKTSFAGPAFFVVQFFYSENPDAARTESSAMKRTCLEDDPGDAKRHACSVTFPRNGWTSNIQYLLCVTGGTVLEHFMRTVKTFSYDEVVFAQKPLRRGFNFFLLRLPPRCTSY